MHDLIIVGAGPAGLTAALYAGRSRLNTLFLEKYSAGGRILLSDVIENFPGFPGGIATQDLISRMKEQVQELGIQIELEEVLDLDCKLKSVKVNSGTSTAKAIIIAVGSKPRKLNAPGEEKLIGKGVSYCATCDAPLYREKNVVLVGGGNAAAEEGLYLSRFAKQLTLIHRRNDLRASAILQEKLKDNKKINFALSSIVTQILGSTKVESIKIKDVFTAQERDIPCDGVFVCIGYEPDTGFVKNKLKVNKGGFIITDENMLSSQAGIFAAGDCRKKGLYQVITACAEGAIAADSAYKYLLNHG